MDRHGGHHAGRPNAGGLAGGRSREPCAAVIMVSPRTGATEVHVVIGTIGFPALAHGA
jgi:hypothetical protein